LAETEKPSSKANKPLPKEASFVQALFPVAVLAVVIFYGLILRRIWGQEPVPLELIFIFSATITVGYLRFLGHSWLEVQKTIVKKMARAMPAFFILFCIGLIISSWIVCGTIPMLVYWGLTIINPKFLYIVAFVAPIIFSTLTGTSWGSVGTIGVVILGIATALDANLGITAGAIIGGACFGDKLSPLSDTTNVAALAADVKLFDHIHSMLFTTVPSAVIAGVIYTVLGFVFPPSVEASDMSSVNVYLDGLSEVFSFNMFQIPHLFALDDTASFFPNLLLLLPPAIVLWGSIKRIPTVPVLILSTVAACVLALVFQRFSLTAVLSTVHKGFETNSMVTWTTDVAPQISTLLDRGGLYALNDAIIIAFMVFVYIGALDHIDGMSKVVKGCLSWVQSRRVTIMASLIATAFTNAMTSNQFATSFIVGDAFKPKYDQLGIPRKVLSRSLEDTGTMIENLVPWTTTSLFMVGTLGVAYQDYVVWQFLSLINIFIAFLLASTLSCCFIPKKPATASKKNQP